MAAAGKFVIRALYFCLVARRTVIVNRHMIGVGVIYFVGHPGNYAEAFAVFCGELARQPLCGCGQHGIVVMIRFAEFVDAAAHVRHNAETQLLRFV